MLTLLRKIFFEYAVFTVTILYILILSLFPPYFSGYDNIFFTHALMWGEPSVHTAHASYYLMYPLSWLASFNPPIDVFTLFIFALNGANLAIIARLLIQTKNSPRFSHLCAWLLIILLSYVPILFFQYTVTSSISMAVGLLLLINASRKKKKLQSALAVIYILIAASLRYDSSLVLLPLILVALVIELLRSNRAFLLYSSIAVMGILTINLTQSYYATTDFWGNKQINLSELHESRIALLDYDDISSSSFQKQKEERYDAVGFTEPLRKLFFTWQFQFDPSLRRDNAWWEEIKNIRTSHDFSSIELINARLAHGIELGRPFISLLQNYYYLAIILSIVSLVFLNALFQRERIKHLKQGAPLLLYSALFFLLFALLCYKGRINFTAFLSIFYICFLFCISSIQDINLSFKHRLIHRSSYSLLFILIIFVPYTQRSSIARLFSPFTASYRYPTITEYLDKEMNKNPTLLYFAQAQLYRKLAIPSNLLLAKNIRRMDRFLPMGDWESCLPFYEQKLQRMGMRSDLDFITMKNARFVFEHKVNESSNFQQLLHYHHTYQQLELKLVLDSQLDDKCYIYRITSSHAEDAEEI